MKTIIIEINPDGEIKIDAHGYKGADCEKATKALEEALGTTTKRAKKADWYQQTVGATKQGIGR